MWEPDGWDVSLVTDMSQLFKGKAAFNAIDMFLLMDMFLDLLEQPMSCAKNQTHQRQGHSQVFPAHALSASVPVR